MLRATRADAEFRASLVVLLFATFLLSGPFVALAEARLCNESCSAQPPDRMRRDVRVHRPVRLHSMELVLLRLLRRLGVRLCASGRGHPAVRHHLLDNDYRRVYLE